MVRSELEHAPAVRARFVPLPLGQHCGRDIQVRVDVVREQRNRLAIMFDRVFGPTERAGNQSEVIVALGIPAVGGDRLADELDGQIVLAALEPSMTPL